MTPRDTGANTGPNIGPNIGRNTMKLTDIVAPGAIVCGLKAPDRDAALAALIDALIGAGVTPGEHRAELLRRLIEREARGSTGFGHGVAVPHVKHPAVQRIAAAVGISGGGIDFASMDGRPVYTIMLLLSPENRPEDHLQAMEVIFKSMSKDTFRRFLRGCATAAEVQSLLAEADAKQFGA